MIDVLYDCEVCVTLCILFIRTDTYQFTGRKRCCRKERIQARAAEAQAKNENQPQVATVVEIVELRQVVQ